MGKGEGITKYLKRASIEGDGAVQELISSVPSSIRRGVLEDLDLRELRRDGKIGGPSWIFLWGWIEK